MPSQAETDYQVALYQLLGICSWEARLVSPSHRMTLPDAALYQLYLQSVRELKGETQ